MGPLLRRAERAGPDLHDPAGQPGAADHALAASTPAAAPPGAGGPVRERALLRPADEPGS